MILVHLLLFASLFIISFSARLLVETKGEIQARSRTALTMLPKPGPSQGKLRRASLKHKRRKEENKEGGSDFHFGPPILGGYLTYL